MKMNEAKLIYVIHGIFKLSFQSLHQRSLKVTMLHFKYIPLCILMSGLNDSLVTTGE